MTRLIPWTAMGFIFFVERFWPNYLYLIFFINIWFLSLPHTFSTFARSDLGSKKFFGLALFLGGIFLFLIYVLSLVKGMVFLFGCYFIWQHYHYTKQNFGLARKDDSTAPKWFDLFFYLSTSFIILLTLLGSGPLNFFGHALTNPLTFLIPKKVAILSVILLWLPYLFLRVGAIRAFEHGFIFMFSYIYLENFVLGWLCLNVFHNFQYLSFMKKVEKNLSFLILPIVLTLTFYLFQLFVKGEFIILLMLALNFTHYTFDGLIWQRKLNRFF